MDPKNFPSNLDPKLKEAYDRVMTMNPPTSPQTPTTPPPQTIIPAQPATPTTAPTPVSPPTSPQPQPTTTPFSVAIPVQPTGMAAGTTPLNAPATQAAPTAASGKSAKHGSPIMSVVFIVCGVVFILAYTLFWIKILNFQTPFPLPF